MITTPPWNDDNNDSACWHTIIGADDTHHQEQKHNDDYDDDNNNRTILSNVNNHNSTHMDKEIHIGPMLDYTKHEFRQLFQILSKNVVVWTDMIVDDAIIKAASKASNDDTISHDLIDLLGLDEYYTDDDEFDNVELVVDDEGTTLNNNIDGNNGSRHNAKSNDTNNNRQVIQIGGNDPVKIGEAVRIILKYNNKQRRRGRRRGNSRDGHGCYFNEINLNVDCPSCQVSGDGGFGAMLMKDPERVYKIMASIKKQIEIAGLAQSIDISIKCRIGVDEYDDIEYISDFIRHIEPVCTKFYLHARRVLLDGITTARQNRTVPPLNYPRIYEICTRFPNCQFYFNGGIKTIKQMKSILSIEDTHSCNLDRIDDNRSMHQVPCDLCNQQYGSCIASPIEFLGAIPSNLHGIMVGRIAINNPCLFATIDTDVYGMTHNSCLTRRQVIDRYCKYLECIYPRRCCNDSENIDVTFRIPSPKIPSCNDNRYCSICHDMYVQSSYSKQSESESQSHGGNAAATTTASAASAAASTIHIKISSHIINRSMKPIRYVFVGLPNSRKYLKQLDVYGQDLRIRNCGPGYIIRKVVQDTIPDNLLDKEL